MPGLQEQFEQEPGAQMKKSPLTIRYDGEKYFITVEKGMRIEGIDKHYEQPQAGTEYEVTSEDSLMLQEISTNEAKTVYTFARQDDQIVVIENTTVNSAEDEKSNETKKFNFNVDGHNITVTIDNGCSYAIDTLEVEPDEKGYIKVGDTLIKVGDKAVGKAPHLKIIKKYSL